MSFHLDVFGVFPLVDVGIKRLGLACRRQVLSELPGLEDRLDLGNEGISNRPKVKVQTALRSLVLPKRRKWHLHR